MPDRGRRRGESLGSIRNLEFNGAEDVNEHETCSTNAVFPVSAGQHTVDLEVVGVGFADTRFGFTSLSAIYVPFGATGSPPE